MKTKRRVLSVLLVLCLCMSMLPASALGLDDSQSQPEPLRYAIAYDLTGVQGRDVLAQSVEQGHDLLLQLVAIEGYKLPASEVIVQVNGVQLQPDDYQLYNEEDSCSIELEAAQITGDVEIMVMAEAQNDNADLASLGYYYEDELHGYDDAVVEEILEAGIYEYNVMLPYDIASDYIYIEQQLADEHASVSGDTKGILLDEDGKATATLTVVAEDGITTNTYVIHFMKETPSVNEIQLLATNQVELTSDGVTTPYPSFDEAWQIIKTSGQEAFEITLLTDANTAGVEIPQGKTVTIDLAGCTLTQDSGSGSSSTAIFKLLTDAHLIINDTSSDESGVITSTVQYKGNSYIGQEATSGAIKVLGKGSSFTLNGGTITGIEVADRMQHSVVYVKNVVGVNNQPHPTFTMNGGKITGNDCTAVVIANGATFTMTDGEISDNISNNPGAGVFSRWGKIDIQGGSIIDNQALVRVEKDGAGGGIAEVTNGSTSSGGETLNQSQSGITLSGHVDISGNLDPDGNGDDIVITGLQTVPTEMDPVRYKSYAITIGQNFSAEHPIALSIRDTSKPSKRAVIHTEASDDCIQYFRYVTDEYAVCRNSDGNIVLLKINLAPLNPRWEITDRGVAKAVWDKAESLKDYSVQLYKDGKPEGNPVTPSFGTSQSFTISEPGAYYFKVKALGGSSYADSPEVTSGNLYTVSFEADDGAPVPAMQFVLEGGNASEPEAMVRKGYEFGGWYTDASFETEWNFLDDAVTEPITLYAQWMLTEYDLWVNGLRVTSLNQDDVLGDLDEGATITYDEQTNTLTLNNASLVVDEAASGIMASGDLIIDLQGENEIYNAEENYQNLCSVTGDLTIKGEGSLTMQTDRVGVHASGLLTLDGANISVTAHPEDDMWGWAFESTEGILVENGSKVYVNAGVFGFSAQNDANNGYIKISNSEVRAEPQTKSTSLFTDGTITIDNHSIVSAYWMTGEKGISIAESWVETTSGMAQTPALTDSVVFQGNAGSVAGNAVLPGSLLEIAADKTLTIPQGTSLTVPQDMTLNNRGTVVQIGTINGKIENIDNGKILVPADGITLDQSSLRLYMNTSRSSETLVATVSPDNIIDKTVVWSSADENIATVDDTGKVSAVGIGKTTIKATTWDGSFSAECEVTVYRRPSGSLSSSSDTPTYSVTPPSEVENGTVTVSPQKAESGSDVTVTVKPEEGYVLDELLITDEDGNEIDFTKEDDTTYQFLMPESEVNIEASFVQETGNEEENCPSEAFSDVDTSKWYHEALDYVIENGLMNGISDTNFAPNGTTTRGMLVTILWRLEDQPVVNNLMTYEDVAQDAYYSEAVRWATSVGVVEGYSDEAFGPNDLITREQMAAVLYRYAQHKGYDVTAQADLSQFTDAAQINDYAVKAMAWANAKELINGKGNQVLDPRGNAQRCEIAAILQRFSQLVGQ